MGAFKRIEDLDVYQRLCQLHIEICELSYRWPSDEKYELGSQIRRSSNSAPAQLAERYDDRHIRSKIEGANRSRGEVGKTVHHLYIAHLKGYLKFEDYGGYRERYKECTRMLTASSALSNNNYPSQNVAGLFP
jgi:four helix bundle protein